MTLNTELLFGKNPAAGGYQIERSLRFNSSDSAYLSRTPASAGNRKTWTWAGWVKRGALGSRQMIFGNLNSVASLGFDVEFIANDSLDIYDYSSGYAARRNTTQVFRDCSSWYHIVIVYDSTNVTAADRLRLYVNGSRVTVFANSTDPTLNADGLFNTAVATSIGRSGAYSLLYFNGYLADIHFIDGQALDPTSFTEVDATTGQLVPKAYSGTYGTNGFHLPFSDNSTAAALGTDTSGNGNTWTVNNISVAAGSGNDSLVDTPTNYGTDTGAGGEVRGNYATLNPLDRGDVTLANGNLDSNRGTFSGSQQVRGTIGISSGKWYWEITLSTEATFNDSCIIGIANSLATMDTNGSSNFWGYVYTGAKYSNASTSAYAATFTKGDVIGIAFDADNGSLVFYKNGASQGTAFTGLASASYFPCSAMNGAKLLHNFGQRPFAFPISGFKALCTTNLPEPQTITTSGSYTGNGVADGPFVYLNGVPTAMTVNGNAVTFGTEADKLSNGFKVRTTSTTYNQNAVVYNYSITSTGDPFNRARAQTNP